jgi:hypothetical protein
LIAQDLVLVLAVVLERVLGVASLVRTVIREFCSPEGLG